MVFILGVDKWYDTLSLGQTVGLSLAEGAGLRYAPLWLVQEQDIAQLSVRRGRFCG